MGRKARKRNFNLGNWLVGAGVLVLLLIFLFPYSTAARTARLEERGDRITALLLEAASRMQPIDLEDPATGHVLLGRVLLSCTARGVFASDLEYVGPTEAESTPPGILFRNKHYAFVVTSTPPERALTEPDPETIPALEAYGWPLDEFGPAHATFFWSEIAAPAYTRNLQANYHGLAARHRPPAGCAQRRLGDPHSDWSAYRGQDDERWITITR